MILEQNRFKFWGGIIAGVLLFIFLGKLGVTDGFLRLAIVGLLLVTLFADIFGEAKKWLRPAFVAVAVGTFIFAWPATSPSARWARNMIERLSPKDNFDPKSTPTLGNPTRIAQVKFYYSPDGTLNRVPLSWETEPETGKPIINPGEPGYDELLSEWNKRHRGSGGGWLDRVHLPRPNLDFRTTEPARASAQRHKTEYVNLAAGDRRTFEPSQMIACANGRTHRWDTPNGKVTVQRNGRTICTDGPGVTTGCDAGAPSGAKFTFVAQEPASFSYTVWCK